MSLRMFAPLSLVLFAVIFLIVIVASLDGGSESVESERPPERSRTERPARQTERSPSRRAGQRVYVVKSGDTLAAIAEKTGVPIEQLQALNPELDPRALVTGQRVTLRE
jgi:LysM repeat protein